MLSIVLVWFCFFAVLFMMGYIETLHEKIDKLELEKEELMDDIGDLEMILKS